MIGHWMDSGVRPFGLGLFERLLDGLFNGPFARLGLGGLELIDGFEDLV